MVSSNSFKISFVCAALVLSACSFWQAKTNDAPAAFVPEPIKNGIPFAIKEPPVYQAEIVTISGGAEDKIFAARNGANRLTIFDYQTTREIALLQKGANQKFLINRERKIYTENTVENSPAENQDLINFLTSERLNQMKDAKFENLGAENDLTKYAVRLDDKQNSEMIIYADEKIGLPVKEEFYSVRGEQKTLLSTVELRSFSWQTDDKLFVLPEDYKKVTAAEFYEILRREPTKEK